MFNSWLTKLGIILLVIVIANVQILFQFFQQDEWATFGRYFSLNTGDFGEVMTYLFKPEVTHYVPLTRLVFFMTFSVFKLNYVGWAVMSMVYQVLILITLYVFTRAIFKDYSLALYAVIFFGLSGAAYQATAWPVADLPTHGATFLTLLALIFLIRYIKNNSSINFYYAGLFFIGSLFFKEIFLAGIVLFILGAVYKKGLSVKNSELIISIIFLVCYVSLRFFMISSVGTENTVLVGSKMDLVKNLTTFPYKVFSQSIIPTPQLLVFSDYIASQIPLSDLGFEKSFNYQLFAQKQLLEILSFLVTFIFIFMLIIFYHNSRNRQLVLIGLGAAFFVTLNSLIYAFSPGRQGIVSIIDSRNLYLPLVGTSIFIVALFALIKTYSKIASYIFFALLIFPNLFWLERGLLDLRRSGQERKEILEDIRGKYPNLSENVIFYSQSDRSFYGLPEQEKILPFQSGLGQTLLVWYQDQEGFPSEFFQNRFLWEITDQGYKESEGRGFGYFRDIETMIKNMRQFNLSPETVYGFSYNSRQHRVMDTTKELRSILAGSLGKTTQITPVSIESSYSQATTANLIDQNTETFWSTEAPYQGGEELIVDLGREYDIVQLAINSQKNADQIAIGYQVLVSSDKKQWKQVFNEQKYIPNKQGYSNIYLSPQKGRYAKIVQLGYHLSAHWVIHEINLYAKNN